MSKICIVGDQHFKLDLPYASYFEDRRRGEWNDVKNKIHLVAKECDAVVLIGDNLNSKNNHSAVNAEFVEFLKSFGGKELHILVGNHERSGNVTALDFLEKIQHDNWHVYTKLTKWCPPSFSGKSVMFVPYLTAAMVGAKDNTDGVIKTLELLEPADIAFFHQAISGSSVHGQMVDLFNEIVLPREELEKRYKRILAGHIHEAQELSPQTTITGSMFTQEVGEEKKYIFVYNTETNTTEKIELPERPIVKITMPGADFNLIQSNAIVKCYITDKSVDVEALKTRLSEFDAHIVIEQYPNERKKLHIQDGGIDFSLDNILKMYAEAKNVDYGALQRGIELLK